MTIITRQSVKNVYFNSIKVQLKLRRHGGSGRRCSYFNSIKVQLKQSLDKADCIDLLYFNSIKVQLKPKNGNCSLSKSNIAIP